jgi:hypothetical protein
MALKKAGEGPQCHIQPFFIDQSARLHQVPWLTNSWSRPIDKRERLHGNSRPVHPKFLFRAAQIQKSLSQ